ncbi:Jasmonate-zim-domain protein 6, putative isoform 2 [Hibiscus syriacus]|uniref:Protein TIFY n=1 Tax=Hibiscus syriacus TaxID=106335 RepID=A0A6A3A8G7_HIBSY|nr:protein TIFY 11B-like [Hibiscus syriacus]KAE8700720.1 Jasmonate-zim-domain protein 6, putative isoform 2 [Hibiscus syriacus]
MSNSGEKSGKALERASFVNLLSQFLKEKRNLGDISVGMASKHESKGIETSRQRAATMNFLPSMDNSSENLKPTLVASPLNSNAKPSGFFADIGSFDASSSKEYTNNTTDFRKPAKVEAKNSQLTMFFGGQVVVFNDFPSHKLKEIMDILASYGCSTACSGLVADTGMEKFDSKMDKVESSNPEIPDLNVATTTGNSPSQVPSVERCEYGGSDLRIARRNSLHKFFEKRKDRAAARAPYQVNNVRGSPPPPKPDESSPSHKEGRSSKEASSDLDLKL